MKISLFAIHLYIKQLFSVREIALLFELHYVFVEYGVCRFLSALYDSLLVKNFCIWI